MFQSDESALDLSRRLAFPSIILNHSHKNEFIKFGKSIELKVTQEQVADTVLEILFQYFEIPVYLERGLMLHISTSDNLFVSLEQSHMDLTSTQLNFPSTQNRVKRVTLHSFVQLLALFEWLKGSLNSRPCLLLLECLSPIIFLPLQVLMEFLLQ